MTTSSRRPQCLIVAADELDRAGLASMCADVEISIVARYPSAERALRFLCDTPREAVVVCVEGSVSGMPEGMDDVLATPQAHVVGVLADASARGAEAAVTAGFTGLVPRTVTSSELLAAVTAAHVGDRYLHPGLAARMLLDQRRITAAGLTSRELDVLRLIALGYTNAEAGRILHASARTIETHRSRVMSKLHIHRRCELVAWALEHGVINVPRGAIA